MNITPTLCDAVAYSVMMAVNNGQSFHAVQLYTHLQELMQAGGIEEKQVRNYQNAQRAMNN